jgi:hypothetical protein
MRPSVVEGLWMELNPGKKIKIESGFLYNFSPRSTTKMVCGRQIQLASTRQEYNPEGHQVIITIIYKVLVQLF